MELYANCKHVKKKTTTYSYPAPNGWCTVSFKQCLKCGDPIEETRKQTFSKKKPIKKK